MAHFAELDSKDVVIRVVVIDNAVTHRDGEEKEQAGVTFLQNLYPGSVSWVQTSYNSTWRHKFAGPGDIWDGSVFHAAAPYPSWTLDANLEWQPPTPHPGVIDGKLQKWDEETRTWVDGDA